MEFLLGVGFVIFILWLIRPKEQNSRNSNTIDKRIKSWFGILEKEYNSNCDTKGKEYIVRDFCSDVDLNGIDQIWIPIKRGTVSIYISTYNNQVDFYEYNGDNQHFRIIEEKYQQNNKMFVLEEERTRGIMFMIVYKDKGWDVIFIGNQSKILGYRC